jgi:hypothetical protein
MKANEGGRSSAGRRPSGPQSPRRRETGDDRLRLVVARAGRAARSRRQRRQRPRPSGEIGGRAGLVDEDEFGWIKIELAGEPVPALLQNVRRRCSAREAGSRKPKYDSKLLILSILLTERARAAASALGRPLVNGFSDFCRR